ncbi:MAG: GspH/FimT family pseudopilin [Phycisphaerae bacterium]
MIEVLLTCAIIQIIASMVAVSVASVTSTERTSYAAQETISALRYARQLAQTSGTPCGVIFDNTNQQIRVFRGTTTTIAPNAALPNNQYVINLSGQANTSGVTISNVYLAGTAQNKIVTYGSIGFNSGLPRGLGSTNNPGYITLSRGNASKTITIPPAGEATFN